ncbi:maltotransferase domain-containing protein [Paraburkholderia bannensis]|uniref:maltotransferase domain-containing protein n=1 Tax=Paraburkholderia bannensis TaxID=765414 RepID=UPI002AB19DC5|nr:maltotransferase domain-containing protein [Paraburkholderia bannensis]
MELPHAYAPRIYFVHSVLVGPLDAWPAQFAHAASLGFDHVLIGGLFAPGASGDDRIVADHTRLHPAFGSQERVDDALHLLVAAARSRGITLLADLTLDRTAADGALYAEHPEWFHPFEPEDARLDPRHGHLDANVAYADFDRAGAALAVWWTQLAARLADAGLGGFRVDSPHRVPAGLLRAIFDGVRASHPQMRWLAATPGLARDEIAQLEDAGFDAAFTSLRWWDFSERWMIEEHAVVRRVGSPITFPEAPYGTRLAHDLEGAADARAVERAYRRMLRTAAALGTGWLVPMGFEYGLHDATGHGGRDAPGNAAGNAQSWAHMKAQAPFDFSADIAHANALQRETFVLQTNGELRALNGAGAPVAAVLRGDRDDLRVADEALLMLVNPALAAPVRVNMAHLLDGVPGNFTRFTPLDAQSLRGARLPERRDASAVPDSFTLPAGACWLFRALATPLVALAPPEDLAKSPAGGHKTVLEAIAAPRIAIESVTPSVDHGRFVAKRIVGERCEVRAAIFAEGHDRIDGAILWRAADETAWHEAPMSPVPPAGTDMWSGHFPLDRVGRYEFVVIAWRDDFASLVDHLQKKRAANQPVHLELEEASRLLALVLATAETSDVPGEEHARNRAALDDIVRRFIGADTDTRCALLAAPATAAAVRGAHHRPFLSRDATVQRVDAERPAARFASWYEIFPRSMSDDESRHGTWDDVIAKMPRVRDMGFDVLYFPPIHPIGLANRKGRNNSLNAQPGDVGSPYAIGAAEGGHTAVHPQLGTLEDFCRMLKAAHDHGLEIALDFAIQCSPDHPWLKAHPSWFAWRPDGTLRYAENPPKKYQDIVNPEFYAHDAKPDLWLALRDVILFWVDTGVRIFRVDNPHTKPLPFWEWMIADVRSRHPDVIFLSEAFTRPRLMYRLAKIGFSQSYTYFTWRESKRDFIAYLTELTQSEVRDFYRPNFFVNTPDINPRYLQNGARSMHLIRAALASLLSGLWGVYSGFELCDARPLPNSEEYLDSEKYQLRVWDWNRPGNIMAEITMLNRVRRANPALQTHLGVTFLAAHNDAILCFEKATPARDNVIVVAINLDAYNEQGADIELSWATFQQWQIDDHARLAVVDEMTGERFEWQGRWQHVRLDPHTKPFAIWRIAPIDGLPRETPPESDDALDAQLESHPELGEDFPPGGAT